MEEHQLGEAGPVGHHHAPGLAGIGGRLVAHHLDRQRRHLAGLGALQRFLQRRSGAPVQIALGQMEQQIDHPLAADRALQQPRHGGSHGRAHAPERGQGREKRDERIRLHG